MVTTPKKYLHIFIEDTLEVYIYVFAYETFIEQFLPPYS